MTDGLPEKHHLRKPLVAGGLLAGAAGIGWLARGIQRGKPAPTSQAEAIALFRDEADPQYPARVKIIGELAVRECVGFAELFRLVRQTLTAPEDAYFVQQRREFDQLMAGLGRPRLGDFALTRVATDKNCAATDSVYPEEHYELTPDGRVASSMGLLGPDVMDYIVVHQQIRD